MTSHSKWRHSPLYTTTKGVTRCSCACGQSSGWKESREAADAWYANHTGIKEVRRARQD